MMTQGFPLHLWDPPPQEFVCGSCMFEQCAPSIPVSRLCGHSGVGDAIESFKTVTSDDIQKKMFLDGCLMWNDTTVLTLFIILIYKYIR